MKKLPAAVKRQRATKKTKARFAGKTFDWAGGRTCVHMLRWHLKHFGYKVPFVPDFDSAITAKRALKDKGFDDVPALLDSMLHRYPAPAFMKLGDVVVVAGDGMDAIMICSGPRRIFGWGQEYETPVFIEPDMSQIIGAWRV